MVDREAHLKAVTGSLALEGLKPSEEVREVGKQWAAGEKNNADLEAEIKRLAAPKSRAKAS